LVLRRLRNLKNNSHNSTFLEITMQNWQININLEKYQNNIKTYPIKTARGIFQADSLSALWFCLTSNPLSNALNEK
jgi:hypothetical protein